MITLLAKSGGITTAYLDHLQRKLYQDHSREESRVKLAISRFGKVPKEVLEESLRITPLNVGLMRRNLKEAFEEVVDTAMDLRFITKDVKPSFKNELAIIGVNIDRTFEGKYLELDSELTSMYKF